MIMIYEKNALPTTFIKNVTENAIKVNMKDSYDQLHDRKFQIHCEKWNGSFQGNAIKN